MERDKGKASLKRTGSSKVKALHTSDFIALGSKSTSRSQSVDNSDVKSKVKVPILSASTASVKRKEISTVASSSSSAIPCKRLKISSEPVQQLGRLGLQGKKESKSYQWDNVAIDIEPNDFVTKVLDAEDLSDDEKVEGLLCGAVKKLKTMRAKPEPLLYLGLQYLAKTKPLLFCSELIVEAFCSLLKRDISVNFKTKGNNLVSVLAANVLMAAYRDESNWPELFVKVYIEDSLGERIWVDHEYCKGYVENILTAFNTKPIPKDLMAPERNLKFDNCPSSPNIVTEDDETSCSSALNLETQESAECVPIFPRFRHNEESLAKQVLEVIREQMSRRQPMEISRNTLRFLVSTCGLCEVRVIAAQKLEIWIQNPKLTRPAQELLLAVCLNCNLHNQQDVEVISLLVKTRIKTKPIVNHYLMCMKELLAQNPENLSTLLKHAVYNELSNSRNTNIMQIFPIIFQHAPDKATKVFGDVFFELLLNKEDFSRSLRNFLRELSRLVRNDLNISVFCLALLQERKDSLFTDLEQGFKERVFLMIADFIVFCIFISITAAVKEQHAACSRGERKDLSQLRHFQMQVATITRDMVWWLHTVVSKAYKPGRNEFMHCIHKILFMEQLEHYHKDNFPSEGERMLLLRISADVPVLEDTLLRIMIIGLSREHPLNAADALDLADQLVKRAALVYSEDFPVLEFENPELCDAIFNLCAYHYPENISLPQGYHPPNLAISELYWKAWMMLLVIVSHNPSTFGEMAWKTYPMLRNMMEMCVTSQFIFPPPTLAMGEKAVEEIKNRELQMSQMEKDRILLFESHLAAASTKVTITESNSLLLSKLISMDPHGPARKPPMQVMDQLKQLNSKLRLGELLCHSRNPDFLLDIIQRQGTSQSMPWLSELVESSAGSFNMLPVQCLCEFLINETGNSNAGDLIDEPKDDKYTSKKKKKQEQLLLHLQKLLHESENDATDTVEIINYFMKRLSSQQTIVRNQAYRGLQMVLSQPNKSPASDVEILEKPSNGDGDYDWLLKIIPSLPHFNAVRSQISLSLRQACQIESEPATIAAYVTFLATNTPDHDLQDFADLALDLAQMIVERQTILNTILPQNGIRNEYSNDFLYSISEIFFKYLSEAKSPSKDFYAWSESQDQILIQWQNGEAATMHILVVHAMIIVLTYGQPHTGSKLCFEKLLDNWFPKNSEPPKAFLVDTSEEALLIPDWLKLRMIRSSVDVLVDAALKDLDPGQLVLFIQSFGIPVSSMSKLLKTLDIAVEYDSPAVEQAVLDKSYMSQLVEVQHLRGAKGGEKFAKLLVDGSPSDVIMDVPAAPSQTRVIQRAPPKLPTAIDVNSVSASVLQLFGMDSSSGILSAKQEYELFRGLQKAVCQDLVTKNAEQGAIGKFVDTCERVLSSNLSAVFVQALHKKASYSSVLLRIATVSQANRNVSESHFAQRLAYVCHQIMQLSSGFKSSLLTVATQFYNKCKPQETKDTVVWKEFVKQNKVNPLSSEDIIKTVQVSETHDPLRLEEVIHYFVKCAVLSGNTKPLMSAMTNITFKRLTQTNTSNITTFNRSKFCFFVDWLECLNQNVATSSLEPQCQLLFSLVVKQQVPIVVPFRPYLLALLVHQSSWETLHFYINMVLNSTPDSNFDPSSVLDFLDACIHIPKIWQGKYKKKCKRDVEEDVLALNEEQITSVLNYIIQETSYKFAQKGPMNTDEINASELNVAMEIRLPLLMKCLAARRYLIYHSVKHLVNIIASDSTNKKIATELLLHMYLHVPSVLSFVPENMDFLTEALSSLKATYSKMDVISHTLLLSLAKTEASKQCTQKMARIDLLCRKIASTHPVLLLRQLPMISTLLRGRVHLEFSVFRVRNHLTLFNCVLGLIELLSPVIFKPEYTEHLHDILSLYMEVFQTYGLISHKELCTLMNQFFEFLLQYLNEKPTCTRQFITPFRDFLQDLSSMYPDFINLRHLLAGACLHYWGDSAMLVPQSDENFESKISRVFASSQIQTPIIQTELRFLASKLSQTNAEDRASALVELDTRSIKKPAILENFKDNLKTLLQDSNLSSSAFKLMMRLLRSNPKCASYFVSTFLQCLESENRDVINIALEHLPEFVILAQEYAIILLQKAFSIGMLLSINTVPHIQKTISTLLMQNGS